MSRKLKKQLRRIIIAVILFFSVFAINLLLKNVGNYDDGLASIIKGKYGFLLPLFIYLAIYFYIGYDILIKCLKNIRNGQIFDENFLMCIATIGGFALGIYGALNGKEVEGFDEACAVLLFYQIGEWFQRYATSKSRDSIKSLMNLKPKYANLYKDGQISKVDPSELKVGDLISVAIGEQVPTDGIIEEGESSLDKKALTGESIPIYVKKGDNVISGVINLEGNLILRVTKEYENSSIKKILDLTANAASKKSKTEKFITKFAKYYTPLIVLLAVLIITIPSLIFKNFDVWLYRGLSFLVISCPCALVISIPLSFFAGIGAASKNGILVKGSVYLEKLKKANIFIFDKTGTITKGEFVCSKIEAVNSEEEVLHYASICESHSNHPLAKAILRKVGKVDDEGFSLLNKSGKGIVASKGNEVILCGNQKLLDEYQISYPQVEESSTYFMIAYNNEYKGIIYLEDEIKDDAYEFINYLNKQGYDSVMLTGDNEFIGKKVQEKLNIKHYAASLLPEDKVKKLEEIIQNKKENDLVCYLGDGINDAPSLIRSDIGVSMGLNGEDLAIESSDIVLMRDNLIDLKTSKGLANKVMGIVNQNIIFAIGIKVLILVLAALGFANMWLAVFGDVGVAFLAIINASRAGKYQNK